jgi:hypothetical protein
MAHERRQAVEFEAAAAGRTGVAAGVFAAGAALHPVMKLLNQGAAT